MNQQTHVREIPDELGGQRFDQALAELFPEFSRSRLQQWIKGGQATLDGREAKPKEKVFGGENVTLIAEVEEESGVLAQPIPLNIVYEDDSLLVIDKPAGLVVHPAAGNRDGTLQNGLLHYDPALGGVPRAGIVHRLDKETSGLLVVARTLQAHKSLVEQLQERSVSREYRCVVNGVLTGGGSVDAPIGRHPVDRLRQAVVESGREALTHYRILERYRAHSLLRVMLETGRTHQIRVHMAHIHHPLVGDPLYGGRLRIPAASGEALQAALRGFKRQALHAARLALIHPQSGEEMAWESPLPEDMVHLIEVLKADAAAGGV